MLTTNVILYTWKQYIYEKYISKTTNKTYHPSDHYHFWSNIFLHKKELHRTGEVDHGFEPWSGSTKDYEIGICCLICFSTSH
jgi:hypothetical protein